MWWIALDQFLITNFHDYSQGKVSISGKHSLVRLAALVAAGSGLLYTNNANTDSSEVLIFFLYLLSVKQNVKIQGLVLVS